MRIQKIYLNNILTLLYWGITLIIFAFVGSNDGFETDLMVFYLPGTKWFIHLLFMFAFLGILFFFRRSIIIDRVIVLLFVKALWDFFSSYIINHVTLVDHYYFFINADIAILAYFICRNLKADIDAILDFYEWFAVILSIQVVLTSITIQREGIGFELLSFKSYLRIPFAPSNLIITIISPALINIFLRNRSGGKKILQIIKLVLYIIAIIFIRSRGGIAVLLLIGDYFAYKRIANISKRNNRILVLAMFVVLNIVVLLFMTNSEIVKTYFSGYLGTNSFNNLTSRRVEVWKYSWNEFLNKPIFGRGLYYDLDNFIGSTGSHNIVLETLMGSGVIGLAIHAASIIYIIKSVKYVKIKEKSERNTIFPLIVILTLFYVNSMIEVCYYDYIHDVLFWSLAGFLMTELHHEKSYLNELY